MTKEERPDEELLVLAALDTDDHSVQEVVADLLGAGFELADAQSTVLRMLARHEIVIHDDTGELSLTPEPGVTPVPELSLGPLKKLCREYLEAAADREGCDRLSKYEHYIFEAALEAFYGKKVWQVLNLIEQ